MKKFRTAIGWLLAILALFAVVWAIVIAWWHLSLRVVTLEDAILYLGVLPVGLAGMAGIALWWKNRPVHSVQPASPSGDIDADAAPEDPSTPSIAIIAAWASTPAGATASEHLETLLERRTRPSPDQSLVDEQGFPLLTGRMKDLETAAVLDYLSGLTATPSDMEWRDSFARSLSLLDNLLDQVIAEWPFPLAATPASASQQTSATLRGAPAVELAITNPLSLRVALLLPEHFQDDERQLAERFLMRKTESLPTPIQRLDIVQAKSGAAFALAEQFRTEDSTNHAAQAALLLAADSSLCPSVIDTWEANRQLFIGSKQPNGLMPGEGAFGLLYANDAAVDVAFTEPLCRQSAVASASRTTSADVNGTSTDDCISRLMQTALHKAGIGGKTIVSVACDADHRTSRALECVSAMLEQTPHLDAVMHRTSTNEACGHLGAASALAAIVTGATHVAATAAPVLALTLTHPTERAATVLLPHLPLST